jgi:hypothetical protein
MRCDYLPFSDLHHAVGNPQGEAESYRMHDTFSQMLLKDHFQSTQLPEHRLIQVGKNKRPLLVAVWSCTDVEDRVSLLRAFIFVPGHASAILVNIYSISSDLCLVFASE